MQSNIKIWREIRNMTQEQLSHTTGINLSTIRYAEKYTTCLTINMLCKIARVLQVKPKSLLGDKNQ